MIHAPDLVGHWRRDWLRAPGHEDATTRVHWMQAPTGYVDIRIPVDQPKVPLGQPLSALDDWTLLSLIRAEGFAGTIAVADGVCTWDRAINWHGVPESVDAGAMKWDDQGRLIETGVHADYAEQWVCLPGAPNAAWVFACGEARMHVVWSDIAFLIGIGRPAAASTAPLRTALAKGRRPAALADHFAGLYAMGRWEEGQGILTLSTHPGLVGTALIDRSALELGRMTIRRPDFHGAVLTEEWVA